MKWIDCASGERPEDDETVLGKHIDFPTHLPEFVYWDEEERQFWAVFCNARLPVIITHFCYLHEDEE